MADSVGSTPESSTDSTTPSSSRTLCKRSRESYVDTYMDGRSRKAYKLRKDIDTDQKCNASPPHIPEQVCHNCSVALSRVQQSFFGLKMQGSEIKQRRDGYLRMKTSSITETLLLRMSGSVQTYLMQWALFVLSAMHHCCPSDK